VGIRSRTERGGSRLAHRVGSELWRSWVRDRNLAPAGLAFWSRVTAYAYVGNAPLTLVDSLGLIRLVVCDMNVLNVRHRGVILRCGPDGWVRMEFGPYRGENVRLRYAKDWHALLRPYDSVVERRDASWRQDWATFRKFERKYAGRTWWPWRNCTTFAQLVFEDD